VEEREFITVRLHRDVARYLVMTLDELGEHIASGAPLTVGDENMESEIRVLMWDLEEALGMEHPHDQPRPESRY
jgi:hypothetical protein